MLIRKINGFNYKSFKNYTGPDNESEFKEKNIFFGYNGRGKSSLAKGIIDEFLKDKKNSSNNFRVFDKNFIDNNIILKDGNSIGLKGVVANFGEKNVELEKEIEQLKTQEKDVEIIRSEIDDMEKENITEIEKIFNKKKGKLNIRKRNGNNSDEIINLYLKDYEDSKVIIKNDAQLEEINGNDDSDEILLKMKQFDIIQFDLISDEEINDINYIINKDYDNTSIPTSEVINWIRDGIKIHDDNNNHNKCIFCGNDFSLNNVEEKIKLILENKKQQELLKLEMYENKINRIIEKEKECNNDKKLAEEIFGNVITNSYEEIINELIKLKELEKCLKNKIANFNLSLKMDIKKYLGCFNIIDENQNNIILIKSKKIKETEQKIDKLNMLIKGSIGLNIKNSSLINKNLEEISKKKLVIEEAKKINESINAKTKELIDSQSNINDFVEHLDIIINNLELNFKLDINEDYYILKHNESSKELTLDDISEGEKNILALLYFYFELFTDKEQKKLKPDIFLIIIDDPISSMDDINKMYVLQLLKRIVDLHDVQLFIFTHVWDDFCNLCYGKKDKNDTPYRLYEIKKDNNGSKIEKTKTNITPYHHDFKEIYDFSCKTSTSDFTDCEIYHYPNTMRRVLESFMSFKVKNNSPTQDNFENVKTSLCGENSTANDELCIGTLLNVCNILSHNSIRNADEILNSAKYLMNKIKMIDKQHYNTMKQ